MSPGWRERVERLATPNERRSDAIREAAGDFAVFRWSTVLCPSCRQRSRLYDGLFKPDGTRATGIFINATGMNWRCPACDHEIPVTRDEASASRPEVILGQTQVEVLETKRPPIDNRHGVIPSVIKRVYTEEWSQTVEFQTQDERHVSRRVTIGPDKAAIFESTAEQAIRKTLGMTNTRRTSRTDELSFEVSPGICRDVFVLLQARGRSATPNHSRAEVGIWRCRLRNSSRRRRSEHLDETVALDEVRRRYFGSN